LGLSRAIAGVIGDPRRQASCQYDLLSLWRQRLDGLALGYEDLNDCQTLRKDPALQTAAGNSRPAQQWVKPATGDHGATTFHH